MRVILIGGGGQICGRRNIVSQRGDEIIQTYRTEALQYFRIGYGLVHLIQQAAAPPQGITIPQSEEAGLT